MISNTTPNQIAKPNVSIAFVILVSAPPDLPTSPLRTCMVAIREEGGHASSQYLEAMRDPRQVQLLLLSINCDAVLCSQQVYEELIQSTQLLPGPFPPQSS
jgi:hypothetical protein